MNIIGDYERFSVQLRNSKCMKLNFISNILFSSLCLNLTKAISEE